MKLIKILMFVILGSMCLGSAFAEIDLSPPVIINNIPNEINTYDLNLSSVLSCQDENLALCSINFTTTNQYYFYPDILEGNWSTSGTAGGSALYGVTYGDGRFVAVGVQGNVRYSDDGITWTTSGTAGSTTLTGVTYSNDRFAAVGNDGAVRYSDDGITWSTSGTAGGSALTGVTYGNDRFVAVGLSGNVRYSDDGITWSSSGTAGSVTLNGVTYGDGRFVAVGDNGAVRYQDYKNIISFPEQITLNQNGNISYTITATDLANNTATENGNLLVNPFVYLNFNNSITNNSTRPCSNK